MQYYMGMLGHAAFVKTDGTRFAHIHPTGSVSMASLMLAENQLSAGKKPKSDGAMDMAGMDMPGMDMSEMHEGARTTNAGLPSEVTFPYGFPAAGRYRIFVQMKHDGTVETGAFDVDVNNESGSAQRDDPVGHWRRLAEPLKNGRREVQTVVGFLHSPNRNARPGDHPDRMGRDPEKAAVVSTRVEVPRVEVPAIGREHVKVSIDESALSSLVTQKNRIHSGTPGNVLLDR